MSVLTQLLPVLAAGVEVEAIPAVITFFNTVQANAKLPVELQPGSDALAFAQLEQNLLVDAPSLIATEVGTVNAIVVGKLQAALTAAQKLVK
jgi:hypothetical protein